MYRPLFLFVYNKTVNTDEKRWQILQVALHEKQLEQAFALFREAGIEPIVIKGWAAVRFYPEGSKRFPGDIDLCIAPEQYAQAYELLDKKGGSLPVDLHEGFRRLDAVTYADLFANTQLIRLGDTNIRVLADEDHLRVQCTHWLLDGGAYREKLKDIHYAVENRRADFDWERCLNAAGEKRHRWTACAILLAHKYLGTNIDGTPLTNESDLPEWLIKTVEREWADPVRLQPLKLFLKDRKGLWHQLKKRFPPNALQATIEMEGYLDVTPRIYYQLMNTVARIAPSIKRLRAASKK